MKLNSSRALGRPFVLALTILLGLGGSAARAQLPFFPGAEGYGSTFFGTAPGAGWFSDAEVYHVTNLDDSGAGSLRNAFVQNSANKIIVFDVAGTIQLDPVQLDIKNLSNYYIAGQTAPGPVTITGATTLINASNNKQNKNIVLRYLTLRGGGSEDVLGFKNGDPNHPGTNMIIDHASVTWGTDETLSVANNNTNISIQNSLIADAAAEDHSYGSLIRPRVNSNVSLHHNLYANNTSRQPRLGTYLDKLLTADVRNNVIYNWSFRASYAGGSGSGGTEHVDVNYVGNYLVAGPWTSSGESTVAFTVDNNVDVEAYQSGNLIDPDEGDPNDADEALDGADTGWGMWTVPATTPQGTLDQRLTPFSMSPVTTQSAANAYDDVIDHVGNSRWGRDAIDTRIVGNVQGFTAPSNGPDPSAPIPAELTLVQAGADPNNWTYHPGGWDNDNDGLQDAWETEHGGNLVWNADFDSDGYINLIEYINDRGEFPATAPIDYVGPTAGASARYALIQNWRTNDGGLSAGANWQPSRYDVARIFNGTIKVDAVGQHAGILEVAPNAGNNATLDVTGGWIKIDGDLGVGSASGGTGVLAVASGAKVYASSVYVGPSSSVRGNGEILGDVYSEGLITPGTSVGALTVTGDFTQYSNGVLRMEINSLASFDQFNISGTFYADGTLDIDLGYSPLLGDSWDLLDFFSAEGSIFVDLPQLDPGLAWNTDDLLTSGMLSIVSDVIIEDADFNGDDVVDGLDFLAWQIGYNSAGGLAQGDANNSGFVDGADLAIWESQYGTGGGGLAASAVVPEPASSLLVLVAASALLSRRIRF